VTLGTGISLLRAQSVAWRLAVAKFNFFEGNLYFYWGDGKWLLVSVVEMCGAESSAAAAAAIVATIHGNMAQHSLASMQATSENSNRMPSIFFHSGTSFDILSP
jgi:hypothetical protein